MMDMLQVTTFLGWCSVINVALLLMTTLVLLFCKQPILRIHCQLFDLDETDMNRIYISYIAHYKIVILMLNVVPYLALRLMA